MDYLQPRTVDLSAPPTVSPPAIHVPAEPLAPLRSRANVTIVFLLLTIVGAALSTWATSDQASLIERFDAGGRVSLADLQASDDRVAWTSAVALLGYLPVAVVFLLWYSRAYRNAIVSAGRPRFGPRWAIAYWFIPIISFWRPKQVMNDIWRAHDPGLPNDLTEAQLSERPVPALLNWWWGLWVLSVLGNRYAFNAGGNGETVQDFQDQASAYAFSNTVDIVTAILAVFVVRKVTARVQERQRALER